MKVRIEYTNWRGEFGVRTIAPFKIWLGSTTYHPEPQWFLDAHDFDKNVERTFAMKDIRSWTPVP